MIIEIFHTKLKHEHTTMHKSRAIGQNVSNAGHKTQFMKISQNFLCEQNETISMVGLHGLKGLFQPS